MGGPHDVTPRAQLAESPWIAGRDGLAREAARLLDWLPELLSAASERAEGIIRTSPLDARSIGRLGRLLAIAAPELVPALRARNAESVVPVLARLALHGGPTYVKLGQLISSTRGLAPDWVAEPFAGCRDAVPPAPREAIAAVLARSGIDEHLRSWNRRPMASASVAQVHEAVLEDGTDVVLKIRRPGIVGTVAGDASYLLPLLRLAESRDERLRIANLHGTVELMLRLFAQEVDLRLEAASIVEMALAFERAGADVEIPRPVPGLITKRVLAMDRIHGVSAADEEASARFGHHAPELVRLAVVGVLQTTLVDGLFHGDLHLGNVLITERGLALIDFGIMGRLSVTQRTALLSLVQAAFLEDRDGVVRALHDFGALSPDVDLDAFLAQLPRRLSPEERAGMRADEGAGRRAMEDRMTSVVRALSAAGFRVPPELSLFAKNLVYLGDAITRHAPDMDPIAELGDAVTAVLASAAATRPQPPSG